MPDGWIVKVTRISNDGSKSSMMHQDSSTGDVIAYKDLEHAKKDFGHMVLAWNSEDANQWHGSSVFYDVFINRIRFKANQETQS